MSDSALLRKLLGELPDSALVLDVGGWAEPHPRADWVIDIGSWETRYYYDPGRSAEAPRRERFTRETWVEHDICAPGPWPFEDGMFDFVICSQTLEDVRDPVKVCAEMERVGKAGYVQSPHPAVELTRGIESPLWCGWYHHRWLISVEDAGLVFFAKPHNIHHPLWPAVRSPRLLRPEVPMNFELAWQASLPSREEIVIEAGEVDRRLREIAARSSRRDPLGTARRATARRRWAAYRRFRSLVGRVLRFRQRGA